MTMTLQDLRAEHKREVIGPGLKRLLERVAFATARRYPPSYSDAGVWNEESASDALQGWVTDRLIGRRDLSRLLAGAGSIASLRAGLTRSFEQHLTNRRERSSATNLYQRTVKMLRGDADFVAVGNTSKPHEQLWRLASDLRDEPSTASLRSRLQVASRLSDEDLKVIKYGPFSLKSSPILREPALKRFLAHLLAGVGALTPTEIMEVMRRRFALVEPEFVEFPENVAASDPTVHDQATQKAIAQSIATRLGAQDVRVLAALAEQEDLAAAARVVDMDEWSVQNAYAGMLAMVAADAVEPDEAEHICGLVLETLFGGRA